MKDLPEALLKLQSIDFGESTDRDAKRQAAELRTQIPPPILAHYDRLRARGRKGVAVVNNQVCSACHMSVPIGVVATLMHGTDIQLCGSCGRYLCLPPGMKNQSVIHLVAAKPDVKPHKRKALSQTA